MEEHDAGMHMGPSRKVDFTAPAGHRMTLWQGGGPPDDGTPLSGHQLRLIMLSKESSAQAYRELLLVMVREGEKLETADLHATGQDGGEGSTQVPISPEEKARFIAEVCEPSEPSVGRPLQGAGDGVTQCRVTRATGRVAPGGERVEARTLL